MPILSDSSVYPTWPTYITYQTVNIRKHKNKMRGANTNLMQKLRSLATSIMGTFSHHAKAKH